MRYYLFRTCVIEIEELCSMGSERIWHMFLLDEIISNDEWMQWLAILA